MTDWASRVGGWASPLVTGPRNLGKPHMGVGKPPDPVWRLAHESGGEAGGRRMTDGRRLVMTGDRWGPYRSPVTVLEIGHQ